MEDNKARGADQRLEFHLLGNFEVLQNGLPLPRHVLGTRKGRSLLKLLLLYKGQEVSADRIIEALWPEGRPAKAEENVAALVSRLRSVIGTSAIAGGRQGYRFVGGPNFGMTLTRPSASS